MDEMRFLSHIRSLQLGILFLDYEYDREAAYVSPCGQLKVTVLTSSRSGSRGSRGNPCASLVFMLICAPRWARSCASLPLLCLRVACYPFFIPFCSFPAIDRLAKYQAIRNTNLRLSTPLASRYIKKRLGEGIYPQL